MGRLSGLTLLAIFALASCGHALIALSSRSLFRATGEPLRYLEILLVHVNRLPARYLPGGIWQTVARSADFSARGLSGPVILRVLATEMVLGVALAAMLGGVLLGLSGTGPSGAAMLAFAAGGFGLALPVALARRRPLPIHWSPGWYGAGVLALTGAWACYGLAFWLFVEAALGPGSVWEVLGVYYTAWVVGYLAFFAPQGIGVFEVTAVYLLGGSLAAGLVAAMFGFRALTVAADLLLWATFRIVQLGSVAARRGQA